MMQNSILSYVKLSIVYLLVASNVINISSKVNYKTEEGLSVILNCSLIDDHKSTVKWKFFGQYLNGSKYTVQENGNLKIHNVILSDAGNYSCEVTDNFGLIISKDVTLIVKEKTRINQVIAPGEIVRNQTVRLRCSAITDHITNTNLSNNISWYHNRKRINFYADSNLTLMANYSLQITKVQFHHSGTYTCVVNTEHDEARIDIPIIVQDVPNQPQITKTVCQGFVARIKWKPQDSNNAPILSYSIYYNTSFTPDVWLLYYQAPPTGRQLLVHSMSPWTKSSFRIVARNKIGDSNPSEPSRVCSSPSDVPHRNPGGVTTDEDAKPNNMIISWEPMPPIEHNAPGFFYRLYYRLNEPRTNWSEPIDIYNWTETSYEVENAGIYQSYQIKLEAHNKIGKSYQEATEVIGYSGEEVPLEAPNNFTLVQTLDSCTATFSWDPVTPESVLGYFRGYQIESWTHSENNSVKQIVRPDHTQTTFNGLEPHQLNHVQLRVVNNNYEGPSTPILSIQTLEDKPGPVDYFKVFAKGSTSLFLKWAKPLKPNGNLTNYKIYYAKIEDSSVMHPTELESFIGPNQTRIKLSGLEKNTKYRLSIAARTLQGDGPKYYIEESTEISFKPPYKSNFTWKFLPKNSAEYIKVIKIIWLPTVDQNVGDNFFVQYRIKGEHLWYQTEMEHTNDSQEINLKSGNIYEVKIVTVNGDYFTSSDVQEIEIPNW